MNVALMGSDKGIQVFALIGLFATALAGCTSSEASDPPAIDQTIPGATKWGYYSGEPVTRWSPDGRKMILVTELRYTDPKGEVWVAPAGSVVDGASIPRSLWSLMGGPFEGQYRNASVLHDVAYEKKTRPWEQCDRMFYNAMRCSGVNAVEAGTMYYALRKFGHHWKHPKAEPVKLGEDIVARGEEVRRATPVNRGDIDAARDWIRNSNPTPEQIEQRADAER